MRNEEFIALALANANKTRQIRVHPERWGTSTVYRVPNPTAREIGKVIAFLQDQIDKKQLLSAEQSLLIYNFYHMPLDVNQRFFGLELLMKPIALISNTQEKVGEPFALVINSETGEVMNSTKAMLDLGLITNHDVAEQGLDVPTCYGNYKSYPALCCFAAITYYRPLAPLEDLFQGKFNASEAIKHCVLFDSADEAVAYLKEHPQVIGRYIAEIPYDREIALSMKDRLGEEILKIISYPENVITLTSRPEVLSKDADLRKEAEQLAVTLLRGLASAEHEPLPAQH